MPDIDIVQTSSQPKEVSIASVLIPYALNDDRCKYFSWVCCGLSDEEALFVLGLPYSWLELQRCDEKFHELESRLPELRKELGQEYAEIDFYRNFRLVLEKDYRIIRKSLGIDIDAETGEAREMTLLDHSYLLKMRSAYTPQQLMLLKSVASGNQDGFNFSAWVSQNKDIVQVKRVDTVTMSRERCLPEEEIQQEL